MRIPSLPVAEGEAIPRVVHQVWVGGEPPEWVNELWSRWDLFASANDIHMRRWLDRDVEGTLTGRLASQLTAVQIADFLRIEALIFHGGLYMDSDTIPLANLDEYFGERGPWLAHGQAFNADGSPTVSNAMMGAPQASAFMGDLFAYAARALERGVTDTFSLAGPTAYRRVLNRHLGGDVSIASPNHFPAYRAAQKVKESRMGRPLTEQELHAVYPEALVVHLSANSWRPSRVS